MNKLVRFFMLGALVCSAVCCGKDKEVEPVVPLIPAFVSIDAADASLLLLGDADSKEITVSANREVAVTVDDAAKAWLTATITATDAATSTAKLTLAVTKNVDAYKGRSATISLAAIATAGREDEDLTVSGVSAKTSLELKQSIFGLPEADLLNVVFTTGTVGVCAARDISPLANVITDGLPNANANACFAEKVYPTVSPNALYGRNSAHFSGGPCSNGQRGACLYRVDMANYGVANLSNYYNPSNLSGNSEIPLTDLGKGLLQGSYSVEVIFKPDDPANGYGEGKILGWYNSHGGMVGIKRDAANLWNAEFSNDMAPVENPHGTSNGITTVKSGENSIDYDHYYHLIGVYDRVQQKHILYLDGKEVGSEVSPGYVVRLADITSSNALAQWLGIGGDARRADPIVNGAALHLNTDYENWGTFVYTGEIVVARFYGRTLTATEVTTLYEYEKPE
jgi:hypothetical protein